MPSSTVRREKLVSRVHLIAIAVLFAVSFLIFLPARHTFTLSGSDTDNAAPPQVDDLDLAYFKARAAAGEPTADELIMASTALIKSGKGGQAKALLDDYPQLNLADSQRYQLDLELAASNFYSAAEADKERAEMQLFNVLHILLSDTRLHDTATLSRASTLSKVLPRADLTESLYSLLGSTDSENALHHFEYCGDFFASVQAHRRSSRCYRQALAVIPEGDKPGDSSLDIGLEIKLLQQVAAVGDQMAVDQLVSQLTAKAQGVGSTTDIQAMAAALLEAGRPDVAHQRFAQLADLDAENSRRWWIEASKWAEASADPALAANYLVDAIKSVPPTNDSATSDLPTDAELETRIQRLLVAAGNQAEALAMISQRIEKNPQDLESLEQGVVLANQLGKPELAASWNRQLLDINPDDVLALERQVEISLASRDLEQARYWMTQAYGDNPRTLEQQIQFARIVEWQGDPVAAQRRWQKIALEHQRTEHYFEVVRLAEMNFDFGVAAMALREISRRAKPDSEMIAKLTRHYEGQGAPLQAAGALEEIIENHGASAPLLQELADLYYRHVKYEQALIVWQRFTEQFGATMRSKLMRSELNWRLNQTDKAATVARTIDEPSVQTEATEYQIKLLSELSWRYRLDDLALAIKPRFDQLDNGPDKAVYGSRLVASLDASGEPALAAAQAEEYWQETGDQSFALKAMSLAVKANADQVASKMLARTARNRPLRELPEYWTLAAQSLLQQGKPVEAFDAYERALILDAKNVAAVSGLIWAHIGEGNKSKLAELLIEHAELADNQPVLWSPFAVGHVQTGNAKESLRWFDRLLDTIDADYSMLLTYADALDLAGRVDHGLKVRRFALQKLRPLLAAGSVDDTDELVRQYTSLISKYADAETRERWVRYLLQDAETETGASAVASTESTGSDGDRFWKQDIAISWLMSSQRHQHARLVMARLHDRRLQQPEWQSLALAMESDDRKKIEAVLSQSDQLSLGNRILALRQLGREKEAYALAATGLRTSGSLSEKQLSEQQYVYLRGSRPSYTSATAQQSSFGNLTSSDAGFNVRHTFANRDAGSEVAYRNQTLKSDDLSLEGLENRSDITLTLNFGNSNRGGHIAAGVLADELAETVYGRGRLRWYNGKRTREWYAELAYNEQPDQSSELRVAGVQNRASAGINSSFGVREFFDLRVDAIEVSGRLSEQRVARGLETRGEMGMRGSVGSNAWSASVVASRAAFERNGDVPDDLLLSENSGIDSLIAETSSSVALATSLSRGGVDSDFPATSSPRYYVNSNLGYSWPDKKVGFQFETGAGIRVLGGDELSFAFSHDALARQISSGKANSSSFGLNYKYHFRN